MQIKHRLHHKETARGCMKKVSALTPLLFFLGFIGLVTVIARTSLFTPLVRFVHAPAGGFWPLVLCVGVGIGALWLTYRLLNIICGHYSHCFDIRDRKQREHSAPYTCKEEKGPA